MEAQTRHRWWSRFQALHHKLPPKPRKIIATTIGVVLIAAGTAMILLPGPAFIVIPAGLAVLSTEYTWARKLFSRVRSVAHRMRGGSHAKKKVQHRDEGLAEVTRRGFRVPV